MRKALQQTQPIDAVQLVQELLDTSCTRTCPGGKLRLPVAEAGQPLIREGDLHVSFYYLMGKEII
jgi:hypothetical protein